MVASGMRKSVTVGAPSSKGFDSQQRSSALCLVVLPLPAELPRGRGDDAGTRDCGLPRDGAAVVLEVRPDLGQRLVPSPDSSGGHVAPRRGVHQNRGQGNYLWRAVDQHGNVLDILVTSWRDATAAIRFVRKLLKNLEYVPRVLVTDKLAGYGAARRRMLRSVEHRKSKYLSNRAENSHQPTRHRERAMKRLASPGHAPRFLSAFSGIFPHFRPRRHRLGASEYRREMDTRFTAWYQITGTATVV
jgi:transposase-like protein